VFGYTAGIEKKMYNIHNVNYKFSILEISEYVIQESAQKNSVSI